jgi:predicted nucleic acid-binding protein
MATPDADRLLLDTNVLLAATDEARGDHEHALASLNVWPASGVALYTSGQILREYLAVATRPVSSNGLGMAGSAALSNVRALRERLHLLDEDARVADRLLAVLDEVDCTGKQVHDANVVATMLVHGIDTIATSNTEDFARFRGHVRVVGIGDSSPR